MGSGYPGWATENGFSIDEDGDVTGFGTSRFYIKAGGNVGINTTSPALLLEVNGTAEVDTGLIVALIYPASDSTTAIKIDKADGSTNVVNIDTTPRIRRMARQL
jgi:hypothetical protein